MRSNLSALAALSIFAASCGANDDATWSDPSSNDPADIEVNRVAQPALCDPFTATNDAHVLAGRARKETVTFLFFTFDTYFAAGTNDSLGIGGATTTTLYEVGLGSYSVNGDQCSPSNGPGLPPVLDYGARGPFPVTIVRNTGPDRQYTMFRPTVLGQNGFKHPIATWGNGIITTPELYIELLSTIASHGFVLIASNSSTVNAILMRSGLDWLIQQNALPGDFQGKLDTNRAASIGYSLGGGAAVDTGSHPSVVCTISFHGLQGRAEALRSPLLLMTSTGDNFVSAAAFVTPTFNRSAAQTFYGTLTGWNHLYPLGGAGDERAPAIAWLRLWVYGDQGARQYFYGNDCIMCRPPWVNPQRKNWR